MSSHLIQQSKVVQAQLRTDIPEFTVGSVVSVHYKIKEGVKERIQIFSGIVIDRHQKTSINASFKVLKVSTAGIKTMRTFPVHSPNIDKVVVTKLQRGRRATLNYLIKMKDPIKAIRAKKVQPKAV
jgi:large subunit ribosomal protein L19